MMAWQKTMRSGVSPDRLVWMLTAIVSIGVTAVLPVLPIYANQLGASPQFLGGMMAGYWGANLVALPASGWLSDRFGRRPVLFIGLLAYGLASLGFLVVHGIGAFIVLRAVEGLAGACVIPAAMAYAADCAPAGRQGSSMAKLAAAEHVGILIGPMIGGALAAQLGFGSPFIALGVLCFAGLFLVVRMPESHRPDLAVDQPGGPGLPPFSWASVRWTLAWGLAGRSWASGFSIGLYEVVWPLFMLSLGASVWQITLSWTVFAIPSILLSPVTGRLIDRCGGGRLAVWGAAVSAALTLHYAAARDPWFMILLSLIEGIGVAVAYPGQTSLMV
ncbi:MAG: MFS transporter, partial [Candidatus Sericytochromatia bacterium]|nr:MFS transporter [Candidatus Sericytochromatia bacterium]